MSAESFDFGNHELLLMKDEGGSGFVDQKTLLLDARMMH
jgi:hypothetical protein